MANLNYVGSLAEQRMKFRSTTDVVVNNLNELFHAISIYIPKRFAAANIIDWDDSDVSAERPAVTTVVVDNYTTVMKGELADQWRPIFRQDTNSAVILYLIVFDDSQPMEVTRREVNYAPLTAAFKALFAFSYFKMLFDPSYSGADVTIPPSPGKAPTMEYVLINETALGSRARQTLRFLNTGRSALNIPAGVQYEYYNGSKRYIAHFPDQVSLAGASAQNRVMTPVSSTNFDPDPSLSNLMVITPAMITPAVPTGVQIALGVVTQGNGTSVPTSAPVYFNNTTEAVIQMPAGVYRINSGAASAIDFELEFVSPVNLMVGGIVEVPVVATTIGEDTNLTEDEDVSGLFVGSPLPPAAIRVFSKNVYVGSNAGAGNAVTITAGTYLYSNAAKDYPIVASTDIILAPNGASPPAILTATSVGIDPHITTGNLDLSSITPSLPSGISVLITDIAQGSDAVPVAVEVPSMYYDLSIALALLCRNNLALSWMWSFVRVSFTDNHKANSQDKCWLIFETRQQQLETVGAILENESSGGIADIDRARYYWAVLYYLECQNTALIAHSSAVNIIVDVLAAWFAQRNSSGTFIGNKLSLLRLSGTRIKPLGWPSWVDSSVNENAEPYHQQLRDMNVGFLATIADNTPQESYLTMARGIGDVDKGLPVSMMMIAKFCDYTCSMEAAKMITDTGTLTNPILTDEAAYARIQRIVAGTLNRFSGTSGRLYNVSLTFPDFSVAKVSRTALSAASAWSAKYKDDLDEVEVSGGIIAD